ncbi:MAG: GNAT family N-acetyltransferase, partial [Flavobacteriales bacterium CG_4_10_14_0_8_um_filter_32_5]
MNSLNFSDNKDLKQEDLLKLYKDAKWLAYTNNPDLLQQAIS